MRKSKRGIELLLVCIALLATACGLDGNSSLMDLDYMEAEVDSTTQSEDETGSDTKSVESTDSDSETNTGSDLDTNSSGEDTSDAGSDLDTNSSEEDTPDAGTVTEPFLAQGCFSFQSAVSNRYLVAENKNGYSLAKVSIEGAEAFFLKPTGFDTYMIYDRGAGYLSSESDLVKRLWRAGVNTEWHIEETKNYNEYSNDDLQYTVISTASGNHLSAEGSQPVVHSIMGDELPEEDVFRLVRRADEDCEAFPEAPLDAIVSSKFYESKDPKDPVVGFVDTHTHIGFPKALGAMAMSGSGFHRFGIEHALGDCSALHGEGGELDLLGGQTSGGESGHSTDGYPDFTFWPNLSPATHVVAYHRWMERAYLSGMRILITFVTGNPTFCQLLGIIHPGMQQGDCKSDTVVQLQTQYVYDLQDYIDAQAGGPGEGWLRVVTSPAQAREVISQNKLAVILGTEYSTLFDCTQGSKKCTTEYINNKLNDLYDMGIRSVFPIHRFDNAFGGTIPQGGSSGAWMHLTSKLNTGRIGHLLDLINPQKLLLLPIGGHFWQLEECPEGVDGTGNIMSMREFVEKDFSLLVDLLKDIPVVGSVIAGIFDVIFLGKLEPLPEYTKFNQGGNACNVRELQDVGRYLVNRVMDKGMLLEVDHMSYNTMMQTLDEVESRQYSGVVSSHGWIENSPEIRERILSVGGVVSDQTTRPSRSAERIVRNAKEMESFPYLIGVGVGSDVQGLAHLPRGDSDFHVTYPFKSYDGTVTFTEPKTGNRVFDFDAEGMAHYGLLAEWVENLRQVDEEDPEDIMGMFMNSAEAYLQMWERAELQAIE